MNIIVKKNMFNDIYLPYLFDYSHRYNVYYGGRSSGKSYFVADKLTIRCVNDKRRMLFMMKQDNKVQDGVWTMLLATLYKFKIADKCVLNKSEHTCQFPNGSWIKCVGLSDSERIKGLVDISDVWMEEASNFTLDDLELIDGTIRGTAKNKTITLTFNPVSMQSYLYTRFGFDKGVIPDDTFILKTTYKDNKWCDEASKKRLEALQERNPARYKIEAEGNFATLEPLVFEGCWHTEDFNIIDLLKKVDGREIVDIHCGDAGFVTDPTVLLGMIADRKEMKLYIYDEYYKRGMLGSDIANIVKQKGLSKVPIIFDRQEARLIEELNNSGCNFVKCRKGKGSIMQGINMLKEYEIIVHPSCKETIVELENYCYLVDENGVARSDKVCDKFNHCIDSARYGITSLKRRGKVLSIRL